MPAPTLRTRTKKADTSVVEDPFVVAELRALDATLSHHGARGDERKDVARRVCVQLRRIRDSYSLKGHAIRPTGVPQNVPDYEQIVCEPCRACGGRRFWVGVGGMDTCEVCHPPVSQWTVVRRFEAMRATASGSDDSEGA